MAWPKPKIIKKIVFKNWDVYNLSSAFNYVLDEKKSLTSRAIKLFEIQAVILAGVDVNTKKRKSKFDGDIYVAAPREVIASACTIASLKILEKTEKDLKNKYGTAYEIDFLFESSLARRIISRILLTPEGLQKIRYSFRPRQFDAVMRRLTREQQEFAPLYDFSLRLAKHQIKGRSRGGYNSALTALCKNKEDDAYMIAKNYYPHLSGRDRVIKLITKRKNLSAFCWINNFGHLKFLPKRTATKNFADRLLLQAADVKAIGEYLSLYYTVQKTLESRKYGSMKLPLATPIEPAAVSFIQLPKPLLGIQGP
jgi:hypothetical protein